MMESDRFIREIGMIQKAPHNYYFKQTDKTRSEIKPVRNSAKIVKNGFESFEMDRGNLLVEFYEQCKRNQAGNYRKRSLFGAFTD